jgi:hypothetical protein
MWRLREAAQRLGVQLPRARGKKWLQNSNDLAREAVNCNALLAGSLLMAAQVDLALHVFDRTLLHLEYRFPAIGSKFHSLVRVNPNRNADGRYGAARHCQW